MNTVTITGNVTDEPSYGSTAAGTQYCRFAVAVSRKVRKDGSWEDKLDGYFKVVAWRTLAESCSKALAKGTRVQVSGSLQQRSYVGDDGARNTVFEIVAEDVSPRSPARRRSRAKRPRASRVESPPPVSNRGAGFSRSVQGVSAPQSGCDSAESFSRS